jgi:branched-chain amino acid transport system ATP-binding protein
VNACLRVSDLCVAYGNVEALHGANLTIRQGTIVTVIGPNGAGKTTLLSALIGLLPSTGSIEYEGNDVSQRDVEARVTRGMCLVPEQRELFGEMTVEDNLRLGAFPRLRDGASAIRQDLQAIYERFPRLKEREAQRASTLSGGERQMLALGRALMTKPHLLMLDEPSLGLAPRIVRDILHIIADLRQTGVSILLVEQNARAALQVADYGYVLENGKIALEGAASELAANQRVVDTYLGASTGTRTPDL